MNGMSTYTLVKIMKKSNFTIVAIALQYRSISDVCIFDQIQPFRLRDRLSSICRIATAQLTWSRRSGCGCAISCHSRWSSRLRSRWRSDILGLNHRDQGQDCSNGSEFHDEWCCRKEERERGKIIKENWSNSKISRRRSKDATTTKLRGNRKRK